MWMKMYAYMQTTTHHFLCYHSLKWIPEHNTWELQKGKTQKNRNCCRKPLQRCDMEHHSEGCTGTNSEVYNSPEVRKLIWSLSWNPTNQKRTGNQPRSNQSSPESGVKESSSHFSKTSQPQISPYEGHGVKSTQPVPHKIPQKSRTRSEVPTISNGLHRGQNRRKNAAFPERMESKLSPHQTLTDSFARNMNL